MGILQVKIKEAHPIPADVKPSGQWPGNFNSSAGFSLNIGNKYSLSVFVLPELVKGTREQRSAILSGEGTMAHCISCVGEEWNLQSEPTGPDAVGLIMYTAKGKALASGTGRLERNGAITFSISTLYKGMTNVAPIEYSVQGKVTSDGKYEVTVGAKVSDPRT
jgi:hypothetical protein